MRQILLMYQPSDEHWRQVQAAAPSFQFSVARDESSAAQLIKDADAVLGNRYFLQSLPYARRLQWMQSNSTGVDVILQGLDDQHSFTLTSAKGVYADEVADHAVALLLSALRGVPRMRDQQKDTRWERFSLPRISNLNVMILGYGQIGRAVAARLQGFGCRLTGVRLHFAGTPEIDDLGVTVLGPGQWKDRLSTTNAVVMALPKTPRTHHMVSSDELSALPAGCIIVNVGRGSNLDESALQAALQHGNVASAALDVFEEEPLPTDHWMWNDPRILVSPHLGRPVERPPYLWEPLFVENLRRFSSNRPLLNVVDRTLGY